MNQARIVPIVLWMVAFTLPALLGPGCANIVPPGGGPRDSLPPVLLSALPKDSALEVTTQKITLNFDEFIELRNANEKILVAPYPQQLPIYESRLRTLTVRLKDSLLPNTTYVIDFGNAIVDLNEGNVLRDFRYVFSTGARIDTNELTGRVVLAETGRTDSTMFALLYRKEEDSTVAKETPPYVARVDSKGQFRFSNLPEGRFYVYALLDADGNKRYNQPIETFAFADSPVVLPGAAPVRLFAYAEEKDKPRRPPATKEPDAKRLVFTPSLESGALDFTDTLLLVYARRLGRVNPDRIRLLADSVLTPETFTLRWDTVGNRLLIHRTWKGGSNYKLVLEQDYAADTSGMAAPRNDTLSFRVRSEKEYGSLRIRFKNLDTSLHPVLLFYNGEQLYRSYPLQGKELLLPYFRPGSYQLALLFDTNRNGIWDPGAYFIQPRRQPERVLSLGKSINVRENWDNETEIELTADQ
ncbi:MAG TPA: Ig-like domain-containing protein [Lacibacter sp.]|nr:Ig-like domain-containing protein [Lacibacter sp.]HMO88163.1 Ig-like domain-containing protein [Lacibacter sp.]HMP86585.1 Ig-like domain-containing protein [Lacibacter sp.]